MKKASLRSVNQYYVDFDELYKPLKIKKEQSSKRVKAKRLNQLDRVKRLREQNPRISDLEK